MAFSSLKPGSSNSPPSLTPVGPGLACPRRHPLCSAPLYPPPCEVQPCRLLLGPDSGRRCLLVLLNHPLFSKYSFCTVGFHGEQDHRALLSGSVLSNREDRHQLTNAYVTAAVIGAATAQQHVHTCKDPVLWGPEHMPPHLCHLSHRCVCTAGWPSGPTIVLDITASHRG